MDANIIIKNICFVGPGKDTANMDFQKGLNVICGASETGKSFLVEVIDYLLGGSELRDIPERVGYDRVRISLETPENIFWTFERSVDGGNYRLYQGLIEDSLIVKSQGVIKAKHAAGKEDNLSGWLLKHTGLLNKYIRTNKTGNTRSLSFRDVAKLVIVNEKEMIRNDSPFLTGQYVTKTAEYAALKLLLTGTDDSAIVSVEKDEKKETGIAAKIELLDQWIYDAEQEITEIDSSQEELAAQFKRLENSLSSQQNQLSNSQSELNEQFAHRRTVAYDREKIINRLNEIQDLLERFNLLRENYNVDMGRLAAIAESGTLFVHHDRANCPWCGASPTEGHALQSCDVDVESIVKAASAEIEKIKKLIIDLDSTISALIAEKIQLREDFIRIESEFNSIEGIIRESLSPQLKANHEFFMELINEKSEVSAALGVFEKLEKLTLQKFNLLESAEDAEGDGEQLKTDISKYVLNEFSAIVQRILDAWDFPDSGIVYFDDISKDFVINGKLRGSRGKGLRAITHAAVTLGLLEFCQKNSLPHPGFVVIDSPLLAYYEPESEDDSLQGSELKKKFYKYLLEEHSDNQIIIIENQHPPEVFEGQIFLTVFTKNPLEGRFGLFPH
jgi:hypothetical protein